MLPGSREAFHFGVNFLLTPLPDFSPGHFLSFQQTLAQHSDDLVFDRTGKQDGKQVLVRENKPLQVTVGQAAPSIVQLLVVAPSPERVLDDFMKEAHAVAQAYTEVWPDPSQVVRRDCTIRYLYSVREEHAFRFLWETRLGQSEEDLRVLERGVHGGGLRLVMPKERPGDPTVEVKVESYLQDSRKLFTECQFTWEDPEQRGAGPNPRSVLEEVQEYMDGPVSQFIQGEEG